MDGKGDPLKIVQEIEILPDNQMVYAQINHPFLVSRPDLELINKKKTCYLVDFDVPAGHRVKMKESEKIDKY